VSDGLHVTVDARALDIKYLRAQGIGRHAHGLLGPLAEVAAERGGRLEMLRSQPDAASPFGAGPGQGTGVRRLRRPPFPARYADVLEQVAMPLDLRLIRPAVHHSLSLYRAPVYPGVPHVMTLHDVVPLMWPERYLRTGTLHKMLYRGAVHARLLLTISEAARADIVAHLPVDPARVQVVPLAADERFAPADPAPLAHRLGIAGPYVVWVGGLATHDPRKDLEGLIAGFAEWQRERDRAETLVLAGGIGPAGEELRRQAQATGARIVFPGFVADEDLPALYSGARCFVTASRYEGFGLPALEAVSCGTPVVAYDSGAVPEVAGPGGVYAPDGDRPALLAALERICDDDRLHDGLRAEGLGHAARYSWRRTAEETWAAYERVAAA
jgi:glycosyltransferase involved in cell wall biosynthesis